MKVKIGKIILGVCATNFYIIYREDSKKCIAIDPADKGDYLYEKLTEAGFSVEAILITHGHFDHIWGAEKLRELTGARAYGLNAEKELFESSKLNSSAMAGRACTFSCDEYVEDGAELNFDDIKIKVIATPGHTGGSCCYYIEEAGVLISGDTLFQESVGRTDLPTGSMSAIVRSIKDKLLILPDDTKVYPGHGESTTIGYEKDYNPFLG